MSGMPGPGTAATPRPGVAIQKTPMKKTSFPKENIKVLLLEGISQPAVQVFRDAGYTQIEHHEKSLRDFS